MNDNNPMGSAETTGGIPAAVVLPAENAAAKMKPDTALQQQPRDMADFGDQFRRIGILNFMRGLAITNQIEVSKLMQTLGPQIRKLEKKQRKKPNDFAAMARLTDSFSRLSFQLTQSMSHLLEIEKLSLSSKPGQLKPLTRTFIPGSIMPPAPWKPSESPHGV